MPDVKFSNQYPYTDFHELNLDWIIKEVKYWSTKVGKTIQSIELTGTVGLVDTYTINYSDGTTSTFDVTNGNGIASVAKTGTVGLVDTYTITFQDGSTTTFEVTNGAAAVDPTLTLQDYAADAKAVGDRFKLLSKSVTKNLACSLMSADGNLEFNLSGYTGKKLFICNKNLLPQFPPITNNGITCVQNADGSVSFSGTALNTATFQLSVNSMPNLGPGTYTISCNNSTAIGDSGTYINVAIDGNYAAIYAPLNTINGRTTFTVPSGSSVTMMRVRISSGVAIVGSFTIFPQCEEGTAPTAFVKHEGTIHNITTAQTILTGFLGYNYVCAQAGVSGTVTYNEFLTDDLNARVTDLERFSARFKGKKIVCFGDSIVGNFQPPTDYPSMIANLTGAIVYNAGFGGCCMSDNSQPRSLFTMCRLADAIVAGDFSAQRSSGVSITYAGTSIDYVPERLDMLESIDWSEIDYILIAYGTNDWNSNYDLDDPNDPDATTSYIGAFRYSVEKLLTAYPNLKIMPITPLWRYWDTDTGLPSGVSDPYIDSNTYQKGTGYYLFDYGDALITAAAEYQIPVFDIYHNCMMNKFNRHEYFNINDGTHPKEAGREFMAQMISAHLNSVY